MQKIITKVFASGESLRTGSARLLLVRDCSATIGFKGQKNGVEINPVELKKNDVVTVADFEIVELFNQTNQNVTVKYQLSDVPINTQSDAVSITGAVEVSSIKEPVNVGNFPTVQKTEVQNLPAVQKTEEVNPVKEVAVNNLPDVQKTQEVNPLTNIAVNNLPAVQDVKVTNPVQLPDVQKTEEVNPLTEIAVNNLPEVQKVHVENQLDMQFPEVQKVEVTNQESQPLPDVFKVEITNPYGNGLSPEEVIKLIEENRYQSGDIRIHNGSVDNIPIGWVLCDGLNGTPNMVDRAIVGAGGAYSHKQLFGSDSRTPSISVSSHTLSQSQMPAKSTVYQRFSHLASLTESRAGLATREVPNNGWSDTVETGRSTPRTVAVKVKNSNTSLSVGGSGSAHNHGASSSAVDTRQKSVAVIWIMKL